MNNVCTKCGKLNTLERKSCHYCGGECKKIISEQISTFLLELNSGPKRNSSQKEDGEMTAIDFSMIAVCQKCGEVWNTQLNKDGKCLKCGATKMGWAKKKKSSDPSDSEESAEAKPMIPL